MHHHNEVSVFTPALSGQEESPAGVGWLVTPSVVVMRLPGGGATSGQPSHVTVPAASGGGRASRDIPVLEVCDSPYAQDWWALALDADADIEVSGEPPADLDLSALPSGDQGARGGSGALDAPSIGASAGGDVSLDGWVCRCFPRLPGCR